jgi:hypothetical protein
MKSIWQYKKIISELALKHIFHSINHAKNYCLKQLFYLIQLKNNITQENILLLDAVSKILLCLNGELSTALHLRKKLFLEGWLYNY